MCKVGAGASNNPILVNESFLHHELGVFVFFKIVLKNGRGEESLRFKCMQLKFLLFYKEESASTWE